jgi:hypothetical protein
MVKYKKILSRVKKTRTKQSRGIYTRAKKNKYKSYKKYYRDRLTTDKKTLNLLIKQYELYASQGRVREWRQYLKNVLNLTDAEILNIEREIKESVKTQGIYVNMIGRSSAYMDAWIKISCETNLERDDITESVVDAMLDNALDIVADKNTKPGFLSVLNDVEIEMYAIENYGYNKIIVIKGGYKLEIPLTKGKLDPVI